MSRSKVVASAFYAGKRMGEQHAYRTAMAVGQDAGNRSMVKAGRKKWSRRDFAVAAMATRKLMRVLMS